MPLAPSQVKKLASKPPEGFKAYKKKTWDPPNRQTFTVEDLAKELSVVSSSLLISATALAQPCDEERIGKIKEEVVAAARHLESVYHRLMNHGIMTRQPADTMTVYRADDIPW